MTGGPPQGYHTVTPRIFTADVDGLVEFMREVFGAKGDTAPGRPAELRIGDSMIMVSSDEARGPMPACLYVYVGDVEATYGRAMSAGAQSVEAPRDVPYGEYRAVFSDSWGNLWQVATRGKR